MKAKFGVRSDRTTTHSVRVRGDKVPSGTTFIMDASGLTQTGDELDNEDIGKYLVFRPKLFQICSRGVEQNGAGSAFALRMRIELTHGYGVHFGVNRLGLINGVCIRHRKTT